MEECHFQAELVTKWLHLLCPLFPYMQTEWGGLWGPRRGCGPKLNRVWVPESPHGRLPNSKEHKSQAVRWSGNKQLLHCYLGLGPCLLQQVMSLYANILPKVMEWEHWDTAQIFLHAPYSSHHAFLFQNMKGSGTWAQASPSQTRIKMSIWLEQSLSQISQVDAIQKSKC